MSRVRTRIHGAETPVDYIGNWSVLKKIGRRLAGTYGRVHGPSRGNSKRAANKATRRLK